MLVSADADGATKPRRFLDAMGTEQRAVKGPGRRRMIAELALVWVTACGVVFAGSAAIEHFVLLPGDQRAFEALHAARGIAASLMSALATAAYLFRRRLVQAHRSLTAQAESLVAARSETRRERQNLQAIIDCMADAVIFVTPDGMVSLFNHAAARLWPNGQPPGRRLRDCHIADTWDSHLLSVADPKPMVSHPIFEVAGRSFEATYSRVLERNDELGGVVMVARDVTERIQSQRLLMKEERLSVTGKLAAGLAHELNNPLGAIALFAQHALGEVDTAHPLADHLRTVMRNANICKKIVRDLLEYARQRPPERRSIVLDELLGDVLRTLDPQAQAAHVTLRLDPPSPAAERVDGDPDQLQQVLVNLGLNAIEAMPDGGTLTFRLSDGDGRVRIGVADTGIGIPPEEREHIFAAFHTTKPEGTGLGLTVARDLVTAHGGTLDVTSVPGQGSVFTVALPAAPPERGA